MHTKLLRLELGLVFGVRLGLTLGFRLGLRCGLRLGLRFGIGPTCTNLWPWLAGFDLAYSSNTPPSLASESLPSNSPVGGWNTHPRPQNTHQSYATEHTPTTSYITPTTGHRAHATNHRTQPMRRPYRVYRCTTSMPCRLARSQHSGSFRLGWWQRNGSRLAADGSRWVLISHWSQDPNRASEA